jgi:hypothetical protein
MSNRVDAVIAALRVVLGEAENSRDVHWDVRRANRWISQLPGARWGRWRDLKLRGDSLGDLKRELFISDLRAVLTYLEANREEIDAVGSWPWPFARRRKAATSEPVDAEFTEVDESGRKKPASGCQKHNVRLLKG